MVRLLQDWHYEPGFTKNISRGDVDLKQNELEIILDKSRSLISEGKPAEYIPELKKVSPELLGLAVFTLDGKDYKLGDFNHKFTIQSVSKVITLTSILMTNPLDKIKEKVSFEPTYDSFNSIKQLEMIATNKPLNPMINSGAIASISLLEGKTNEDKLNNVLDLIRKLSSNDSITYNERVYQSEKATGSRNRALAYYMHSTGIIDRNEEVEEILDTYFKICAIEVDCTDLARIAAVYANKGVSPYTNERYFSREACSISVATMALCGMYDESGEVAITVGLPSKSGVGGGILSVVPHKMGIGIFGPALNEKGTSIAGINMLKMISDKYELSIF